VAGSNAAKCQGKVVGFAGKRRWSRRIYCGDCFAQQPGVASTDGNRLFLPFSTSSTASFFFQQPFFPFLSSTRVPSLFISHTHLDPSTNNFFSCPSSLPPNLIIFPTIYATLVLFSNSIRRIESRVPKCASIRSTLLPLLSVLSRWPMQLPHFLGKSCVVLDLFETDALKRGCCRHLSRWSHHHRLHGWTAFDCHPL
jgi:hypothetical protein